jgi:phosphatidylserine/phosphatidylglycerophosphate/cardiolipin synthase-like enzyme
MTPLQFLGGGGHAIIHSKVVVIDPFSADDVVITGSHNFSTSASSKNDEDFIIIRGDRPLAEAYAVNIMGAYAHYRWRALLTQVRKPFNGLRDNAAWQAPMLRANQRDLRFLGV